jgi:hypothetical protein
MSSLVELKKEIEEVEAQVIQVANQVFEARKELEFEEKVLLNAQNHLKKLRFALDVLEGNHLPEPAGHMTESTSPPPSASLPDRPVSAPTIPRVPEGPICSACGKGVMRQMYRRVPSGVTVSMMQCDDSACNNETY